MAKDGVLFPKPEDTRLRARVLKKIRGLFGRKTTAGQPARSGTQVNRWQASGIALATSTVLIFAVLINFVSAAWLSYTQMGLIAVSVSLFIAVWTHIFILRSQTLLKRGFYAGAMLTIVALVGYTFSIQISGVTEEPLVVSAGATPLEGWSILAAIVIVFLLLIGMLHEASQS